MASDEHQKQQLPLLMLDQSRSTTSNSDIARIDACPTKSCNARMQPSWFSILNSVCVQMHHLKY